ncbi:hypothetical protein [Streptomyces adustus]
MQSGTWAPQDLPEYWAWADAMTEKERFSARLNAGRAARYDAADGGPAR